jgi:hypothetical protein
MTRTEFYEKYGEVKVKFCSYYKYSFTYTADLVDGSRLTCGYGGNSDDIYRHRVDVDEEVTINELCPDSGSVHNDDVEVESFYDYD